MMKKVFYVLLAAFIFSSCSPMQKKDRLYPWESTVKHDKGQAPQPQPQPQEDGQIPLTPDVKQLPPVKVAMMVPLSGKYAELGRNLVDAGQLALFAINEPNLILVPYDTKGTPAGAAEAAYQAVNEGVKLILGPVFSNEAKVISPIAGKNGISIVSFSNDETLAGSGVFAIGFRPEQQVKRVARFAAESGIKEFAAIIPENNYGQIVTKELGSALADVADAKLVKTEGFKISRSGVALSLSDVANNVVGAFSDNPSDGSLAQQKAVFITESGKNLSDILQSVEQVSATKGRIQLLGGEQWNNAETLNNPQMQGAWFAAPLQERRDNFKKRFYEVFSYEPMNVAGLAYDGVALAAAVARMSYDGNISRDALLSKQGFFGVDGIFRFMENGLTERGLAVMVIKNNRAEVISSAPTAFTDVN